jgi:acyl carrier protein
VTGPKSAMIWRSEDIISVIRELARDGQFPAHLVDGEISERDSVDTLGIDSIGAVYLIDRLEVLTGVPMPDDFVPPGTDIGGIAARVNEIVGERS